MSVVASMEFGGSSTGAGGSWAPEAGMKDFASALHLTRSSNMASSYDMHPGKLPDEYLEMLCDEDFGNLMRRVAGNNKIPFKIFKAFLKITLPRRRRLTILRKLPRPRRLTILRRATGTPNLSTTRLHCQTLKIEPPRGSAMEPRLTSSKALKKLLPMMPKIYQ